MLLYHILIYSTHRWFPYLRLMNSLSCSLMLLSGRLSHVLALLGDHMCRIPQERALLFENNAVSKTNFGTSVVRMTTCKISLSKQALKQMSMSVFCFLLFILKYRMVEMKQCLCDCKYHILGGGRWGKVIESQNSKWLKAGISSDAWLGSAPRWEEAAGCNADNHESWIWLCTPWRSWTTPSRAWASWSPVVAMKDTWWVLAEGNILSYLWSFLMEYFKTNKTMWANGICLYTGYIFHLFIIYLGLCLAAVSSPNPAVSTPTINGQLGTAYAV